MDIYDNVCVFDKSLCLPYSSLIKSFIYLFRSLINSTAAGDRLLLFGPRYANLIENSF